MALFSWVGWQVSRWLRPWAKSADRLFDGAPRISPRPSPEAIHIFPCQLRGVGTPGYLFLDRDRGTSELLAEFFRGLLLALANPAAVKELSRYLSFLAILLHGGFFSFSSPIVSIGRGLPLLQFQQPQLSSSLAPAIVWNTASALRSIETLLK
jgi:hypothetical protein